MRYPCPFCTTVTKDDGNTLHFYHIDYGEEPRAVGFIVKCSRCGAIYVSVDNRDEDAYRVGENIIGWFAPEHWTIHPLVRALAWDIKDILRAVRLATDLFYRTAYNRWRKTTSQGG